MITQCPSRWRTVSLKDATRGPVPRELVRTSQDSLETVIGPVDISSYLASRRRRNSPSVTMWMVIPLSHRATFVSQKVIAIEDQDNLRHRMEVGVCGIISGGEATRHSSRAIGSVGMGIPCRGAISSGNCDEVERASRRYSHCVVRMIVNREGSCQERYS